MKLGMLARTTLTGLLAGVVAAFAMTLVMTLLRLFLGVPLPAELAGDRFLPTLFNVQEFLRLLAESGGPIAAKSTALFSGFAAQVALGAVLGALYALVVRWPSRGGGPHPRRRGLYFVALAVGFIWVVSVVVLWPVLGTNFRGLTPGLAVAATIFGFLISFASYGVALVPVYRAIGGPVRDPAANRGAAPSAASAGQPGRPIGRREFLAGTGGVILAAASGGGVRRVYDRSALGYDGLTYLGPEIQPITPNDQFYVVTKNIIDPYVTKSAWSLQVTGLVDSARTYGFRDLAAMPSVEQEMTLECISNPVAGGLMSNAVWDGVPLRHLIEASGPRQEAVEVFLHAADGYTHSVSLEKALEETTLVAYRMNGEPLPDRHGYPARVLVPGYFGEGSVKWVTRIELVDRQLEGYYGKQGWKPRNVPTTSRFYAPDFRQTPPAVGEPVNLKGLAFAADRGVSRVEVSTDGGDSWREAEIDYRGSKLSWVFWNHDWEPEESGEHTLVVRATDGEGRVQNPKGRGVGSGRGSRGYHQVSVQVQA